jgi:hypothetical protein
MKIYKIAQSKITIPPEFGESSIPNNNVRLMHYTRGNIEEIKNNGLLISKAQGHNYGEPDMIWGSTSINDYKEMSSYKNIIEFSVPVTDILFPRSYKIEDADRLNNGNYHVGIFRDVRPEEILAIHEPWHNHYRYIMERKDTIQEVLNGELDNITEDKFPSEYKAIQAIKINYSNQMP